MSGWEPPNKEHPPPKPGEPPLHRAAREGDHGALRCLALAAAGADLNVVFDIGLDPGAHECPATPLMVAAGSGDGATVETVGLLLALGADPRVVTQAGSAADRACRGLGWNYRPGGDAARLLALLDAGSPLGVGGKGGSRLVADTAELGDAARLSVLLRHGGPVNASFEPQLARQREEELLAGARELEGAEPNPLDDLPEDLRALVKESSLRMENEMTARVASRPSYFETPLFQAAASGSAECVRLLLEAGADLHQRDDSGETALWRAGSAEVARLLVERGLPLEARNHFNWTPLISNLVDPERTAALIAAGADVNATSDRGYTVFMSAVGSMERSPEVLRMLVAAGADPHAVSELGYNAFHAAIDVNGEANDEESVRATLSYLKELGVDMERRNNRGQTPLARAIDEGTGTEVRVLCQLGADPNAAAGFHCCDEDGCGFKQSFPLAAASRAAVDAGEKTAALIAAGADPLPGGQKRRGR